MYLYFFATGDAMNNLDWFVVAPDTLSAMSQWLKVDAAGSFIDASSDIPKIFTVPTNVAAYHKARPLNWHDDLREIPKDDVQMAFDLLVRPDD